MRARTSVLVAFCIAAWLALPSVAHADNWYYIIGHGGTGARYAGVSANTYAYPWIVNPTGLHVSSAYAADGWNNYIEAGLDHDGNTTGMFIAYEDYPRTGSLGNQQLEYRVPVSAGYWYRFRIENTSSTGSSWDVWCDGTKIIDNLYVSFKTGNSWSSSESYFSSDDGRAYFNLLRRKWVSDQAWHDWTTLVFNDHDTRYYPVAVGTDTWYTQ